MSPLQDKLDAFTAVIESGEPPYSLPRSIIEAMHKSVDELIASGQAERAKKAGDTAPTFSLEEARGEIESRGATLVAVSVQTPAHSRDAIDQNKLGFTILSDPRGEITDAYGIRFAMQDYLVDIYKNTLHADLAEFNNDPSWTLPMPARYIVGQDGIIAYAEVSPDHTKRPEPSELLPTLDRLSQSKDAYSTRRRVPQPAIFGALERGGTADPLETVPAAAAATSTRWRMHSFRADGGP